MIGFAATALPWGKVMRYLSIMAMWFMAGGLA